MPIFGDCGESSASWPSAREPHPPRTAAKPQSPAKRASIYDKTADAKVQVAKATARAKQDDSASC